MHRRFFFGVLLVVLGAVCSVSASAAKRHHAVREDVRGREARRVVRASSKTASSKTASFKAKTRERGAYAQPARAPVTSSRPARVVRATVHAPMRLVGGRRRSPHTASRLHHARSHGTAAVRAAAREAQVEAAENEQPANQPAATASLNVPQIPLHAMNLPPMRGSHESLVRQNERADQEGLARIQDDADIRALLHNGLLVALPVANGLHADPRLPENRRYCRPFTAQFLNDLSRAYHARFGSGLQVNSAVRTVEYQRHLLRVNGNAAPADGDIASPHLTGATIDIAKKGLSPAQVAWMRAYLSPLESSGKLDVEEEFYQSCFHISVYQSYAGGAPRHGTAWMATRLR